MLDVTCRCACSFVGDAPKMIVRSRSEGVIGNHGCRLTDDGQPFYPLDRNQICLY